MVRREWVGVGGHLMTIYFICSISRHFLTFSRFLVKGTRSPILHQELAADDDVTVSFVMNASVGK